VKDYGAGRSQATRFRFPGGVVAVVGGIWPGGLFVAMDCSNGDGM
jgi:hypothetical protein